MTLLQLLPYCQSAKKVIEESSFQKLFKYCKIRVCYMNTSSGFNSHLDCHKKHMKESGGKKQLRSTFQKLKLHSFMLLLSLHQVATIVLPNERNMLVQNKITTINATMSETLNFVLRVLHHGPLSSLSWTLHDISNF